MPAKGQPFMQACIRIAMKPAMLTHFCTNPKVELIQNSIEGRIEEWWINKLYIHTMEYYTAMKIITQTFM